MNGETPTPQTTLVILLGASEWPRWPDLEASTTFANSAEGVRSYFLDPLKFHLPPENLLDLFDSDQSADDIDDAINQFLHTRTMEMNTSNQAARDVLIYFIGHAGFAEDGLDYYLAIRRTRKSHPETSGLRIVAFAKTVKENARYLRRVLILDCCYAASAFNAFHTQGIGLEEDAMRQTFDAFSSNPPPIGNSRPIDWPRKGTTLLCSSSKSMPSLFGDQYTEFTGALLHVLNAGSTDGPENISFYSVADLVRDVFGQTGSKAPRPEVHSPDQSDGDIATIPFFPNPHAQQLYASSPQSAIPPLMSASTQLDQTSTMLASQKSTTSSILTQPSTWIRSRRFVVSLAVLVITGGSLFLLSRRSEGATPIQPTPPSATKTPTTTPTLTLPVGTVTAAYRGHTDGVSSIAWSPDSKRVASASADKTVQVWYASDGSHILTYSGHSDVVSSVSWSPDGKYIVSAGVDKTVQVWDSTTGNSILTYPGHSKEVRAVAWSPDGKSITSSDSNSTIQVWDPSTGKILHTYHSPLQSVESIAWSPDSKRIVSRSAASEVSPSDANIQVWDTSGRNPIFTLIDHNSSGGSVAWSPKGEHIAFGNSDQSLQTIVQVVDVNTGNHVLTYSGHPSGVNDLAWSPDGKYIASASYDRTVQIWNATNGSMYYRKYHHDFVFGVAWSPNGAFIASGGGGSSMNDQTVFVWKT